jgi:hypothetical protein
MPLDGARGPGPAEPPPTSAEDESESTVRLTDPERREPDPVWYSLLALPAACPSTPTPYAPLVWLVAVIVVVVAIPLRGRYVPKWRQA